MIPKSMQHSFAVCIVGCALCVAFTACSDSDLTEVVDNGISTTDEEDYKYIGKETAGFKAEEWFPGGELGTTTNTAAHCYEDETPSTQNADLMDAFNTDPKPTNLAFRLESTIGIIGSGLLDAIPEDSIKMQYQHEAPYVELNPNFWDKEANDWAAGAWYTLADGTKTNQFDNPYHNFQPEMTDNNFWSFMVWHRGLAIPRARDLNDKQIQRGKYLFNEIGCATGSGESFLSVIRKRRRERHAFECSCPKCGRTG